ncbi:hypothetical protein Barb4_01763 [Bacteroidales bacterium Barb4]|nr:hypothetical protein Barb4_01763 [Bacteroidales bacterium Barb4]
MIKISLYYILMLRGSPKGTSDFSPTCSEAECGVKDDADKEVLKGRPNILYCKPLFIVCIVLSEHYLMYTCLNPTFHFAACGAEIRCPFGTLA